MFISSFFCTPLHTDSLATTPTGIIVDLREPEYMDGVIRTTQGGIIQASNMRIQAQKITYKHCAESLGSKDSVIAEGDVRLEYNGYLFIGEKIEYNLSNNTGFIYEGKSALYPWIFGGKIIQICRDGSYIIYDGYVTTSESLCPDWKATVEVARFYSNHDLNAKNVKINICSIPIFWSPKFCANLDTLGDMPVKYTLRWGGKQGSRIGMTYEIVAWDNFTTFFRLDYNIKRGLGAGFESHYRARERKESFDSINYFAKDQSPTNEHLHTRYRFQGRYRRCWYDGKTLLELKYDKLSDKNMATDYSDRGLDLEYARRTDLLLHHQEKYWLGNLLVRPRLNTFQTIKQELPTLSFASLPQVLASTGIISSFQTRASYLDFLYAHGAVNVHDFTASRVEIESDFYRPFGNDCFKITPQAKAIGIYYGNTPYRGHYWLATGVAGIDAQFFLSKHYSWGRHIVRPYSSYNYTIQPTIPPNRHYIFDITDGWYRVNTLRIGVEQDFMQSTCDGFCFPSVHLDTYVWGLIDDPNIPKAFSNLTTNLSFSPSETLHSDLILTWDLTHGGLAQLNYKSAWTISKNLATAFEYRQRNPYFWRKVDRENFTIDYFRPEKELLFSPMSDKRRTLLFHLYYKFDYDWALEWESRYGWDRRKEPHYFEYSANLHVNLPAHWKMKFAYQRKVVDTRFAIYFTLETAPPKTCYDPYTPPCQSCSLWY